MFGNKIVVQFNNTSLVIEQINHASRIVNVYIVYYLIGQMAKTFDKKFSTKKLFVWSD